MADTEENGNLKKVDRKKKLFIIIGSVLVLVILGVGLKMFVFANKSTSSNTKTHKVKKTEKVVPVTLKPIIVNLADPSGDRYAKVDIVLVENVENNKKHKTNSASDTINKAIIRNTIINVLSSKNSGDLVTNAGKNILRKELISSINKALNEKLIRKIYFTSFIIQ